MYNLRAEVPDALNLSLEEIVYIETYASKLLEMGRHWPEVTEDVAVVEVASVDLSDGSLMTVYGEKVHVSGGKPWRMSRRTGLAVPLDELVDGLYALDRLRGNELAATLDVIRVG